MLEEWKISIDWAVNKNNVYIQIHRFTRAHNTSNIINKIEVNYWAATEPLDKSI